MIGNYIRRRYLPAAQQIMQRMNLDTDPILPPRFVRFVHWFAEKLVPFIMDIALFIVTIYVFQRIYGFIGFEKTVIIMLAVLILMSGNGSILGNQEQNGTKNI